MNTLYVEQSGLGLPDPKYYTEKPAVVDVYTELLASLLSLAELVKGDAMPEAKVCHVL